MKIGIIPREDATNINHSGIGDIRWSSNIYYFLKSQGYDIEYVPHTEASQCDLYLDVHLFNQCEETNAKRHVHFSFWSQNFERRPQPRVCCDGNLTMIGTSYRRTFEEDKLQGDKLIPLFLPIPYPEELVPRPTVRGFDRNEIFWGIRRCYNPNQGVFTENLLRALLRLNKKADFTINFVDYSHVSQGEHLISQFSKANRHGRISWNEVLDIEIRSKLNMYHNDESGASTNEGMFCGSVPLFPASNKFWYVPEGMGTPTTEQELYDILEALWFDEQLYQRHWNHYQDAFNDHRGPKLAATWRESLEKAMSVERN